MLWQSKVWFWCIFIGLNSIIWKPRSDYIVNSCIKELIRTCLFFLFIFFKDNHSGWNWTVCGLLKCPVRQHLWRCYLCRPLCGYDHLSPADQVHVFLLLPNAVYPEQHSSGRVSMSWMTLMLHMNKARLSYILINPSFFTSNTDRVWVLP